MKTVVLGANGQLGTELRKLIPQTDEVIFASKAQVDINITKDLSDFIKSIKPDLLINAAAYTAVDQAESEREQSFQVNCTAPAEMAALSAELNFKLIHVSTDYVFNGQSPTPYEEYQDVDPLNVYGESKAEGEKQILERNPKALIVRTSWVHSSTGKNFVKTVLRIAHEKKTMKVVNDQIGSPTWAADLAKILLLSQDLSGIFHYTNEGVASWYDFAYAIRHLRKLDFELLPIPTEEYPTPARRPRMSLLNKNKIKSSLGIQIPHWVESLEQCLKELS